MYHDAARVGAFVAHLRRLARPPALDLHVVITDNGRERDTASIPGATIFTAPRNLGYLGGCLHALAGWRADGRAWPEWTVVSNTDLVLGDDFLLRLAEVRESDDLGVIAPDVRLPSRAAQNPLLRRRPPRTMMLAYALLARSRTFALAFESGVRVRHFLRAFAGAGEDSDSGNATIYAPHGSIVLFHRRFFERGATLRYGGMMFGEEIHIAEQARRAGLRVTWRRDLRVVHEQHATMRDVRAAQRHQWLAESAGVLWRDYFAETGEA